MEILKKTGLESIKKAKDMLPEAVISLVKEKGLTGRGGAGFPTGLKWEFVSREKEPPVLICNFDEGEPGTFKDKFILENNPELLIEGIAIACHALKTNNAYIYFRAEYYSLLSKLTAAIDSCKDPLGDITLEIIHGAGAYICGDETSIMNSIEGKAGHPRQKPPYPAQKGLWQKPTCVNNVETLSNLPLLFSDGWDPKLRLFSVSGEVDSPGVFELPIGTRFSELADKCKPRTNPKAVFFGASGGCIPYSPDYIFEKDYLKEKGCGLGSCTIIFASDKADIVDLCHNISGFFVHESCGKCTPCREGNYRVHQLLGRLMSGEGKKEDLELLDTLANFIRNDSFCPLGQSSCNHLLTALKYFRGEFEGKCK